MTMLKNYISILRGAVLAATLLLAGSALAQTTATGVINGVLVNKNGISLQFDTDPAGVTLGAAGTNAATVNFGNISAFGPLAGGVTRPSVTAANFTVRTIFDVQVVQGGLTSTTYTLTAPATQPNTPPTLRLTAGQMSVGTGDLDRLYPGITVIRSNGAVLTTGLQTRPLPTGVSASAGAQYSYVDGLLSLTSGTVTFVDGLQLYWLNIDAQGSGSHLIFNGSDNVKGLTLGGGADAVFQ